MSESVLINKNIADIDNCHNQKHISQGVYLKSMIYGGLDGCINSLVLILSGIASQTDPTKIMILAISAIVGEAIGMGLGDYISAMAQLKYTKAEEKRELYEIQHMPNDEKKQIIDIYSEKGYTLEDASRLSELFATYSQAFELGLVVGSEDEARKCGIVTFLSFILFGGIIVLPYVISWGILSQNTQQPIPVMCIGFAKAAMIGLNKWKSGMQTLLLGSAITAIGFAIGLLFKS